MKFISVLAISFFFNGLASAEMHSGEKVSVGNGHAFSYVKMHKHRPVEIGVALTPEALSALPKGFKEYSMALPPGMSLPPFKHITLDWNPQGHEPDGVYNKPHFDVHFYFISDSERKGISCDGADQSFCMQQPMPEYLVPNYGPTPAGVPQMGWHWVDLLAPEFNGGIFTRTLVHGYYKGEPIFVEPMVTLEYLLSKATSEQEIRQPERYPVEEGHYPAGYKIWFDKKEGLHKIIIKDFQDEGP